MYSLLNTNIIGQKFGIIIYIYRILICSPNLFDYKCSKTVILLTIITIWNNYFLVYYILKCDGQDEISASLLQSHDPSEIILICEFGAQKLLLLLLLS